MLIQFSYNKKYVIQGLRYHFISRREIKWMMILINLFAIGSAVLFYTKKIRPEPFLLGSFIWVFMMLAVWYILPYSIYSKSKIFKDSFKMYINDDSITLENDRGEVVWNWEKFTSYFESPNFFHLYLTARSFFLIPSTELGNELKHELRGILQKKISK